jgi:aspartate aminotransferase
MPAIADRLKNVSVSASAAMTQRARDLAAKGVKVISLSSGEPDFATPANAIEAAHAAALAGDTKYPPLDGTPAPAAGHFAKIQARQQSRLRSVEIVVAGGGKQIIFNAVMATCNPGDEVVIPAPSWIRLCGYREIRRRRAGSG